MASGGPATCALSSVRRKPRAYLKTAFGLREDLSRSCFVAGTSQSNAPSPKRLWRVGDRLCSVPAPCLIAKYLPLASKSDLEISSDPLRTSTRGKAPRKGRFPFCVVRIGIFCAHADMSLHGHQRMNLHSPRLRVRPLCSSRSQRCASAPSADGILPSVRVATVIPSASSAPVPARLGEAVRMAFPRMNFHTPCNSRTSRPSYP